MLPKPIQKKPTLKRTGRFGLRPKPEQEALLRAAAQLSQKTLTDFILDSACHSAEQTLLDQKLFMVSSEKYENLWDLIETTSEKPNRGLEDLFSRPDASDRDTSDKK